MTKEVDRGGPVRVGQLLIHTITVDNLGPNEAADVVLGDDFAQTGWRSSR